MKIPQQKNSSSSTSKALIIALSLAGAYGLYRLIPTSNNQNSLATHAAEGDTIGKFKGKFGRDYTVKGENVVTYEYKGKTKTSTIKYRWDFGYCGGTDGNLYFFKSKDNHNEGYTWTSEGEMTEVTGLDQLCYYGAFFSDRWYFDTKDYKCYYWETVETKKFVDCFKAKFKVEFVPYAKKGVKIVDLGDYDSRSPFTFEAEYKKLPTTFEFDLKGLPEDIGYVTRKGTFIPKRFDDIGEKKFTHKGDKCVITSPYGGTYSGYDKDGKSIEGNFVFKRWIPASKQFEK